MRVLSSVTHPHTVCMSLFPMLNTKNDIWKNSEEPDSCWSPLTSINKYYGSQWGPSPVWLPAFFKISSFMFNIKSTKKKHSCLEWHEDGKIMTICSFLGELFHKSESLRWLNPHTGEPEQTWSGVRCWWSDFHVNSVLCRWFPEPQTAQEGTHTFPWVSGAWA